jgi:hypothetical protein
MGRIKKVALRPALEQAQVRRQQRDFLYLYMIKALSPPNL